VAARAFAQPAPPKSEPDFARASELYEAATRALGEGRADDAVRDFSAAYEITKDPVLFFKLGSAYEKAGKCRDAIGYYQRYLDEAKPAESFAALTRERIAACTAALASPAPSEEAAPPPAPAGEATPPRATGETTAAPAGATEPAPPASEPSRDQDRAWLFVGASLAFATAGVVLAYSTSSAEQDLKDLYVSNHGEPPEFDAKTQERYDDLIEEGRRYQVLAWTSFGLAAGCALGATIFFLRDRRDVGVAPVVTPQQTGFQATLRF
jgi:tetratricopeptide (TPR) repeat protein